MKEDFDMKKLYIHGTIITMDEQLPIAEAICIENGIITKVGSEKEILKLPHKEEECMDLQGKTMLPGFIDAHSHFSGVANALAQCDLQDAKSFADIQSKMKSFIDENAIQPGEWVLGRGYDHNFLMEKHHPNRHLLDAISTKHPIVIVHASSHMGVVNTRALEIVGIDASLQDPKGGRYGREEGEFGLNGYMEEAAFLDFQKNIPMLSIDRMLKLFKKAQDIYASYGITTVQEGMMTEPLLNILKKAAMEDYFWLDVIGYLDLKHCRSLMKQNAQLSSYVGHFRIGGYKMFLDGSPQGRTAWMTTPYQNAEDGYCGYPAWTDEEVKEMIENALADKAQLIAHCNGDAAAEQYITQFERVHAMHPEWKMKRPVMIHAQLVRRDQLQRMPAIDMIPSFFIAHTYFWGDIHIENFGKKRAASISPAKTAQELGLRYTFHQDSPILQPDMMRTLWCAVNRKTKGGAVLGESERVTPYEALKAITIHGAYQYFEEHQKGSISEGKLADLVILEENPLTCAPSKLYEIKVIETIKGGKTIYKRIEP